MRRRVAALGLAVPALAGLGVALWPPAPPTATPVVPVAAVAAASTAPAASTPLPARPAAAAPAATALQGLAAGDDGKVEICGAGRVDKAELERLEREGATTPPPWAVAAEAAMLRRSEAAKAQLAARLAVGGDVERVAGRLLMGDAEGGALVAAGTADASAYRLALSGCGKVPDGAACAALNLEGWMRLDPGDARPWLRQLTQAMNRKDEAAASAALDEVLQRPRLSLSSGQLMAATAGAAAVVADKAGLGQALIEATGREAAFAQWDVMGLWKFCSADGLKDGRRLPRCERATRLLLAGATDLLEGSLALKLADRTGIPAADRPFDAATLKAATDRYHQASLAMLEPDCGSLQRLGEAFVDRARQGELKSVLALVAPAASAPR